MYLMKRYNIYLTLEHREVIEDALKEKMNFTDIAD